MWFSYETYETPNSAKFMCLPFSHPTSLLSPYFSHSLYLPPSLLPSLSLPSSLPQVSKDESASKTDPATLSTAAVTYKVRENQHYVASSMRRPKTWREELKPREPLYVGVITATKFLHTRARAVNNTWGKLMPKLEFFSAPSKAKHGLAVVNLPDVDDSYPPQKKSIEC